MKKLYEFSIPDLPPSLDSIYKVGRNGIYKSQDVAVFEKICRYTLPKIKETIKIPVFLSLTFIIKDKRKFTMSDTDNRLKVMLDTLQHFGVVENDRLIEKHYAERVVGASDGVHGSFFDMKDPELLKVLKMLE